jgi:hypothetical protein
MNLLERAPVLDELDGVVATPRRAVGSSCLRARPGLKASSSAHLPSLGGATG